MPAPTVSNGVQVVNTYRLLNGDVWQNVLNYQGTGSLDATKASHINDIHDTQWLTNLRGVVSNDVTYIRTRVTDLSFAPYTEYVFDKSSAGNDAGNNLPAQVASCISLHTGVGGRSGRGRVFLGGLTVTALDANGALTSTYRTAISAWLSGISVITSGGTSWALGVFSRKLVEINPVTTQTIDTRADTQRRRANIRIP